MTDIRICFFGDSYVNGTGDAAALGWVGRAIAKANKSHFITYYNLGIRGNTSKDIANRWKQEATVRLVDCDKKYVVFAFGTNDTNIIDTKLRVSLEETLKHTEDFIKGASIYDGIVIIGPPPLIEKHHDQRNKALDKKLQERCKAHSVPYISLYNILLGNSEWLTMIGNNDQYHPGGDGYELLAMSIISSPQWLF